MIPTNLKTITILSSLIAVLMAVASAAGLFASLYRDNALVTSALRGNDMATLAVAVPLLVVAMLMARRGSLRAYLIWMGMLGYSVYNYLFYLYGSAFNEMFLAYVALFSLGMYALILGLGRLDVEALGSKFGLGGYTRWICIYLFFFALMLGGIEVARASTIFFTGQPNPDILKFDHPTAVVYATDLGVLIPGILVGAVLLWNRKPWGYLIVTVLMGKCVTYVLALIAMSWFAWMDTGAGDALLPLWILLGLGAAASWAALLWKMKL